MGGQDTWDPEFDMGNLARPEIYENPHPWLRRMREAEPVRWDRFLNGWVVTRYDDCVAALHDSRLMAGKSVSPGAAMAEGYDDLAPLYRVFEKVLLFLDPPEHTQVRNLVSKAFTPGSINLLRGAIRDIADELLDRVSGRAEIDLIADFAHPLPAMVIVRMLGIPVEDVAGFQRLTDVAVSLANPILPPPEQVPELAREGNGFVGYMRGLIDERRAQPRDDLLGMLLRVEDGGRSLDEDTLIATAIALLVAGHETTKAVIGVGTLALLRCPDELARLRRDPALIPGAVEELLRMHPPQLFTYRTARESITLGGQTIEAGEAVFAVLPAANRDPDRFDDPDRLDVGRKDNRHLTFGHSVHFCLGAYLARVELGIALGALLERLPGLRVAEPGPVWALNMPALTLRSFPVAL